MSLPVKGLIFTTMGRFSNFRVTKELTNKLIENGAYIWGSALVYRNYNWQACDYFVIGDKTVSPESTMKYQRAIRAQEEGFPVKIITETEFINKFDLSCPVSESKHHTNEEVNNHAHRTWLSLTP